MEKKKISPVVIVSLLIVGLSLLTASILLYSERMSRETEDTTTTETITETSTPTQLNGGLTDDDTPVEVEGLTEDSLIETTPVTDETGEVDIETQIRAIEQELNAIDEGLYDENDISDSSLDI